MIGARIYARPLVDTSIPLLRDIQAEVWAVADTNPYLYDLGATAAAKPIAAYGVDIEFHARSAIMATPLSAFPTCNRA